MCRTLQSPHNLTKEPVHTFIITGRLRASPSPLESTNDTQCQAPAPQCTAVTLMQNRVRTKRKMKCAAPKRKCIPSKDDNHIAPNECSKEKPADPKQAQDLSHLVSAWILVHIRTRWLPIASKRKLVCIDRRSLRRLRR